MDISRKLMFYTMRIEHPDGQPSAQLPAWTKIAKLPEGQRSVPVEPDLSWFINVNVPASVKGVAPSAEIKISKDRRRDLPKKGQGDTERPVPLRVDESLRDTTHALWWDMTAMPTVPNEPAPLVGLLCVEFNMVGPRATTLATVVEHLVSTQQHPREVFVEPLVTEGALARLQNDRELRTVRVRGPAEAFPSAKDGGPLASLGFHSSLANIGELEISISRKRFSRTALTALQGLAKRLQDTVTANQDWDIEVTFKNGDKLDLDHAFAMSRVEVAAADPLMKAVSSPHMFFKMREVYRTEAAALGKLLGRKLD